MKTKRYQQMTILVLLLALTLSLLTPGVTHGQKGHDKGGDKGGNQTTEAVPLTPRVVYPKPAKPVIADPEDAKVLVLKFAEGTRVRLRDGQWQALLDELTPADEELLKRAQISREKIPQQLAEISQLLEQYKTPFERLFTRDEVKLDDEKRAGELNSGEELADLNLYYYLFPPGDVATSEQLLAALNGFAIIETAYAQPQSENAQADLPPVTPSYLTQQGYLREANTINPATNGVDAFYAWTRSGGRGDGVRVIDIEGGWTLAHEDLRPVFYQFGEFGDGQHGTAVLGEIVGAENGYGVTGIAPNAQAGVAAVIRRSGDRLVNDTAGAMTAGAEHLRAGDILLIEQHRPGPSSGELCVANCGQFGFIALEFWQADFDAIRSATARGIIVVEAAGNGSMNLDHDRYDGRFRRPGEHPRGRDSGAIIVGAGWSSDRTPHVWSNAGTRVDMQGWGDSVMTLGYGTPGYRISDTDDRQWYRPDFGGTSSASPIVVGAAACLQGMRRYYGRPVLNSFEMRNLLNVTGTLQPAGPRLIGPLPNIRAAISRMGLGSSRPAAMRLLTVRESDGDVDTGLDIQPGDRVVFEAASEIWSGEYYTGYMGLVFSYPNNGPGGWRNALAGADFPRPGGAPYALLARVSGGAYFTVGRANEYRHIGAPQRLYLRINDDHPGNGSGEFGVLVQVYR